MSRDVVDGQARRSVVVTGATFGRRARRALGGGRVVVEHLSRDPALAVV